MDVRARHARVQHIAHDGHRQVAEVFFVVPDGVHVQQPLRGVRMAPVAGVDHMHMRRHVLRNQVGRAGLAVAHHKQVGRHGREVGNGVQQRLALGSRAASDVEVEYVGRQSLGGNFKGGAGARAVLKEQVEHAFAAQQRHLFHFSIVHADKAGGGVEDVRQDGARQPLDGQQVDQLAMGVELGVALVQHGFKPRESGNGRRPRRCVPAPATGAPAVPRARRQSRPAPAVHARRGPPARPDAHAPDGRSRTAR